MPRSSVHRSLDPELPRAPAAAQLDAGRDSGHLAAFRVLPWMRARMGFPLVPSAHPIDARSAVPSNAGEPPPRDVVTGG